VPLTGTLTINGPSKSFTTTLPGQELSLTFTGQLSQSVLLDTDVTGTGSTSAQLMLVGPAGQTVQTASVYGGSGTVTLNPLPATGVYTLKVDTGWPYGRTTLTLRTPSLAAASNGGSIAGYSSTYGGAWAPSKLIDGSQTLGWSSDFNQKTNQYVIVQLANGGTYTISKIRLNGSATGGDPQTCATKNFQIRVSTTDTQLSSFTTVLTATSPQQQSMTDYFFTPVQARYVMLFAVDNYGGYYVEAAELEVY